jgi:hypothetical protein
VQFLPKRGSNAHIARLFTEEGEFANGEWHRGRVLNGDEGYGLSLGDQAEVIRTALYLS